MENSCVLILYEYRSYKTLGSILWVSNRSFTWSTWMELPPKNWLWEIWFLQCSVLGKKIKDLAKGCLQQTTLTEGLCLTANVPLLQACVEPKKTSLWISTIIPYNTSWSRQLWSNIHSCSGDEKRMGTFWESAQAVCLFFPLLFTRVTWLILPVVICLSQRLSHACLSINNFVLWNCEWLIKSVIVYLIIPYYLDNRGNSRANTC